MKIDFKICIAVATLAFACSKADSNNDHDHDAANAHGADAQHVHEDDAEHAETDLAGVDFGDVVVSAESREYCECLLITCHDPFHEKFGADDAEAIAACQIDASGLPVAGSAQMSGNSIECRQYQCDNVGADITCADALGDGCI